MLPVLLLLLFAYFSSSLVFASPGHVLLVARQSNNSSSSSPLTGDSKCTKYMCVSATVNASTVTYVLSATSSATGSLAPSWMGIGFGTQMQGTEMVIMWNFNNKITLSNRKATGEQEPQLSTTNARTGILSNAESSLTGDIKYAFTIPANSDTKQNLIYGFGTVPVESSAEDATLREHTDRGQLTLDLTKSISGSNGGSTGGSDSGDSSGGDDSDSSLPLQNYEKIILAHAIFCALGFLLFLPAGALLARYWRTFSNKWYTGHWILQFGIGAPIVIIGFALGVQSIVTVGGNHFDDTHKKWGIGIFVLYFVQCALGAIIHFFKPRSYRGRPPQNYLHAVVGIITIALAMYQVGDGINDEWPSITGRAVSQPAKIVWIVWIVLIPILYIAGLAFLPKQYRQEAANRQRQDAELHKLNPRR